MTTAPTASQIDAGAKALREHDMGRSQVVTWDKLPNSAKKKWRDSAAVVLTAALADMQKLAEAGV